MTLGLDLVECGTFSIGRTPVTNDQYANFVAASEYAPPRYWGSSRPPSHLGSHPVVDVTRMDAARFCGWMCEAVGDYFRLPTSTEWMWTAQGLDGRLYPWGDSFEPGRCNSLEANIGTTTPVNAYPEGIGPFRTLDMAGNVWEWCLDDGDDGWAIIKGGCWLDADWGLRSVRYLSVDPSRAATTVGFRVARTPAIH